MEFKEPRKLRDFLTQSRESGIYKASIIRRIEEIFELYPKLTYGELTHYILKSTGDLSDPLKWSDSNYLKKVESVQRQLVDCYNTETNTFTKNDEFVDELFLNERISKNPAAYGK